VSRRDLKEAPVGPAARSATEVFLDDIAVAERPQPEPVVHRRAAAAVAPTRRPGQGVLPARAGSGWPSAPARRGRPRLAEGEGVNHVKTTFALPREVVQLVERLRAAPELYAGAIPTKSEVVAEAVMRLAGELGIALEDRAG
jgi:hypothetical protein